MDIYFSSGGVLTVIVGGHCFEIGDLVAIDEEYIPNCVGTSLWKTTEAPMEIAGRFRIQELAVVVETLKYNVKKERIVKVKVLTCKGETGWMWSYAGKPSLGRVRLKKVN